MHNQFECSACFLTLSNAYVLQKGVAVHFYCSYV